MKIPSEFECLGTTIKVRRASIPQKYGHYDTKKKEIVIHSNLDAETASLTFWHEFFHCALHLLSYDELWEDEALVERLAQVTHQLEKSCQESKG